MYWVLKLFYLTLLRREPERKRAKDGALIHSSVKDCNERRERHVLNYILFCFVFFPKEMDFPLSALS